MASQIDLGADILREQVGDYTNIKNLDNDLEDLMEYIAMTDSIGYALPIGALSKQAISTALKKKNKVHITAAYLYCNWRVWKLYKTDEKWAQRYQEVCDHIDALIFDEWKGTKQLEYFIRETD